jgi:hypothetical protein
MKCIKTDILRPQSIAVKTTAFVRVCDSAVTALHVANEASHLLLEAVLLVLVVSGAGDDAVAEDHAKDNDTTCTKGGSGGEKQKVDCSTLVQTKGCSYPQRRRKSGPGRCRRGGPTRGAAVRKNTAVSQGVQPSAVALQDDGSGNRVQKAAAPARERHGCTQHERHSMSTYVLVATAAGGGGRDAAGLGGNAGSGLAGEVGELRDERAR